MPKTIAFDTTTAEKFFSNANTNGLLKDLVALKYECDNGEANRLELPKKESAALASTLYATACNAYFCGFNDLAEACTNLAMVYNPRKYRRNKFRQSPRKLTGERHKRPIKIHIEGSDAASMIKEIPERAAEAGIDLSKTFFKTSWYVLPFNNREPPFKHAISSQMTTGLRDEVLRLMRIGKALPENTVGVVARVVRGAKNHEETVGYFVEAAQVSKNLGFLMNSDFHYRLKLLNELAYIINTLHKRLLQHNDLAVVIRRDSDTDPHVIVTTQNSRTLTEVSNDGTWSFFTKVFDPQDTEQTKKFSKWREQKKFLDSFIEILKSINENFIVYREEGPVTLGLSEDLPKRQ